MKTESAKTAANTNAAATNGGTAAAKDASAAVVKDTKNDASAQTPAFATREDVQQLVRDGVSNAFKETLQSEKETAARSEFVGNRLKNFPKAYQNKLGKDPANWEAEAAAIAAEFNADMAKLGIKLPNVGGVGGGGESIVNSFSDPTTPAMSGPQRLAAAMRSPTTRATK